MELERILIIFLVKSFTQESSLLKMNPIGGAKTFKKNNKLSVSVCVFFILNKHAIYII